MTLLKLLAPAGAAVAAVVVAGAAAWLCLLVAAWAAPHITRGDGLSLVIALAAAGCVVWLLATWPTSGTHPSLDRSRRHP